MNLADIKTYTELYDHYKAEGFTVIRGLSTKERQLRDAKAHVVMENIQVDFKYVPLNGRHYYMFKTEEHAKLFDRYIA